MENFLSKSEFSKIKEQILRGESKIDLFTEEELNVFTDHLLDTFDPDSESDTKLLEQCYTALSVYTDVDKQMPSEQYDAMAESVIGTFEPKRTRMPAKRLVILVAAAIAILALTGCSIVGLIVFDVINLGKDLLNLEQNVSTVQGDMEILRTDEYVDYESVEALVKDQNFPKIYPVSIPNDYALESAEVIIANNNKQVNISYSNVDDSYIVISAIENLTLIEDGTLIHIDEKDIYISFVADAYQAAFVSNGDLYNIRCSDKEVLFELINSLEET